MFSILNIMKLVLIVFLISFTLGSCRKANWYDIKPLKSLAVPSTLKDWQAILDYTEMNTFSPALGEVGSDGHYVSDEVYWLLPPESKNAYTWSHDAPYENLYEWSVLNLYGAYPRIYYCNIVLEGLNKTIPGNSIEQEQWNYIKGQALANRARTFYELSQVYAAPYDVSTFSTDLSIPLRLESDINIPSKRSTVKETYERVISDLLEAKDLLPASILPVTLLNKYRPTRVAILGMLARIYLSMCDYVNAGKYADECLRDYAELLDYSKISKTSSRPFRIVADNSELIWQVVMSPEFYPLSSPNRMLIDSNLFNLYSQGDLRKVIFFNHNQALKVISFKGHYSGSSSVPFNGIATDELYLIRAECYARADNASAAMADINSLLRSRWEKDTNGNTLYIDQSANSADDALNMVLTERRKELLLRGIRWSDLRRLNKEQRFKTDIFRRTPQGVITLEANSYKYTFPIPDDIIAMTGMQQNPGW